MKLRPTPETDRHKGFFDLDSAVSAEFAERLETQREEAREAVAIITDELVKSQIQNRKLRDALTQWLPQHSAACCSQEKGGRWIENPDGTIKITKASCRCGPELKQTRELVEQNQYRKGFDE
jgi:hypothetical protein